MTNRIRTILFAAIAVMPVWGAIFPATTMASYTYEKMADNTGPLDSFGVPAVNGPGTVAFFAFTDAGGQGIYRSDGTATTTIAETTPDGFYSFTGCGTFQLVNIPDIDDSNRVCFRAYTFDPNTWDCWEATYRFDGTTTTALTDSGTGGSLYSDWSNPSVSPAGVVAFRASTQPAYVIGLYTFSSGSTQLLIDDSGDLGTFGDPVVNDSGKVSFQGYDISLGEGIYTIRQGTAPVTVASVSAGYTALNAEPGLGNNGDVAFLGTPTGGVKTNYTWNGTPSMICDTGGPYSGLYPPNINSAGDVAFAADLDATGAAARCRPAHTSRESSPAETP